MLSFVPRGAEGIGHAEKQILSVEVVLPQCQSQSLWRNVDFLLLPPLLSILFPELYSSRREGHGFWVLLSFFWGP